MIIGGWCQMCHTYEGHKHDCPALHMRWAVKPPDDKLAELEKRVKQLEDGKK